MLHRDLVDQDPSVVDDELSWLKRCGETDGACFFNSTAAIDGYDGTSCFKSLSVLGEVFLGAPEHDFLFGTIPGGNNAADFLIEKMPLLRPQYLWLQQSQNLPSVAISKHKLFLPFAFSFDLFSSLK